MKEISNTRQLAEIVGKNKAVLVYFFNDDCAPCKALRPKIAKMAGEDFPLMELYFCNALLHPEIASECMIFSSPTLLVFFDGKESIRESKYISIPALAGSIRRYYEMVFGG